MINSVILEGRITADLVLKMTTNGTAMVSFTLAVNRKGSQADFPSVRAYGKTAELLATYCAKGSHIAIEGAIQTYTSERDGIKQKHTEVIVNNLHFLDKKKGESTEQTPADEQMYAVDDADLPF